MQRQHQLPAQQPEWLRSILLQRARTPANSQTLHAPTHQSRQVTVYPDQWEDDEIMVLRHLHNYGQLPSILVTEHRVTYSDPPPRPPITNARCPAFPRINPTPIPSSSVFSPLPMFERLPYPRTASSFPTMMDHEASTEADAEQPPPYSSEDIAEACRQARLRFEEAASRSGSQGSTPIYIDCTVPPSTPTSEASPEVRQTRPTQPTPTAIPTSNIHLFRDTSINSEYPDYTTAEVCRWTESDWKNKIFDPFLLFADRKKLGVALRFLAYVPYVPPRLCIANVSPGLKDKCQAIGIGGTMTEITAFFQRDIAILDVYAPRIDSHRLSIDEARLDNFMATRSHHVRQLLRQ